MRFSEQLVVRIDPETKARIERDARANGITPGRMARKIFRLYFEATDRKAAGAGTPRAPQ